MIASSPRLCLLLKLSLLNFVIFSCSNTNQHVATALSFAASFNNANNNNNNAFYTGSKASHTTPSSSSVPPSKTSLSSYSQSQSTQYSTSSGFSSSVPNQGSSSSSGNSNSKNGSSNNNSNMNKDEYNVIVLYPTQDVPFRVIETPQGGEVAFAGYLNPQEPCSTIRNLGDVILEIDGATTRGSTLSEVLFFLQQKATSQAYSFVRLRDSSASSSSSSTSSSFANNAPGQLPGDPARRRIQQELRQLKNHLQELQNEMAQVKAEMLSKEEELRELKDLDLQWMEQKFEHLEEHDDDLGND